MESTTRTDSMFGWVSPFITGSYKAPTDEQVKKAEKDVEAAMKKAGSQEKYEKSLPKPLDDEAVLTRISMIAFAKTSLSLALIKSITNGRDNVVASDSNFVKKLGYVTFTAISLPVLAVASVVEGVARKILGTFYSIAFMCKPPVPSIVKKDDKKVEEAKTEKKEEPKKEEKTPSKPMHMRHTEWVKENTAFATRLNSGLGIALFTVVDTMSAWVANFNPFHTTDMVRPSLLTNVGSTQYIPFLTLTAPALATIASSYFELLGESDKNETNFYENHKAVVIESKTEKAPIGFMNPMFNSLMNIVPTEFLSLLNAIQGKEDSDISMMLQFRDKAILAQARALVASEAHEDIKDLKAALQYIVTQRKEEAARYVKKEAAPVAEEGQRSSQAGFGRRSQFGQAASSQMV